MNTPLYPINLNPVATPAEREIILERENAVLRMRVAVLSEALRAAEDELTTLRFEEAAPVLPPHRVIQGVFNKRNAL